MDVLASNSENFPVETHAVIKTTITGSPNELIFVRGLFKTTNISFGSVTVELMDEEKSKSFLGSAGFGLVGAALLGPVGLIAGALVGGNKKVVVFGLTFEYEGKPVKMIVQTKSSSEIEAFKKKAYQSQVA